MTDVRPHPESAVSSAASTSRESHRVVRRHKPTRAKQLGVTDDEYARLLEAQGGRCAIHGCNRTPKTRRFHADHNHETLQRRGLLCHWHNRILPKTAREAYALAQYLDTWEARV